jgi:hypothetical protein
MQNAKTLNPVKKSQEQSPVNVAAVADVTAINRADAFELMENANADELQKLTGAEYLKMEVGERRVFEFVGNTVFQSTELDGSKKSSPAVKLVDKDGNEFIMATTMVVQSLQQVTELPAYVRLTYKGKQSSADRKRSYDNFEVEVFPQQVKPAAKVGNVDGLNF